MKESSARPAELRAPGQAGNQKQVVEPPEEFIKHIEVQASTQTQVLLKVLEHQEQPHWRHWGIND